MELLVILAIPVAVAAVVLYRKRTARPRETPEVPGNDGK
ncbi:hypothetical protein DFR74_102908 [Nocardia puris]|uniref:Uncharacterized protein n=1 Tax=Nocardia puris TaxID=208602 RepID=A0A366DX85_9NOCA|nr:hypothetical protein DFR74_102908 [Nocardia puris]